MTPQPDPLASVGLHGLRFDALERCGEVMEAEGLTQDRELPMTALAPPDELGHKHLDLYAHHVQELCAAGTSLPAPAAGRVPGVGRRVVREDLAEQARIEGQPDAVQRGPLAGLHQSGQDLRPCEPGQLDELLAEFGRKTAPRNWG